MFGLATLPFSLSVSNMFQSSWSRNSVLSVELRVFQGLGWSGSRLRFLWAACKLVEAPKWFAAEWPPFALLFRQVSSNSMRRTISIGNSILQWFLVLSSAMASDIAAGCSADVVWAQEATSHHFGPTIAS